MKKMKQTISIITPSLNQGRYIERTINSVLMQNIENMEYFVIDGGSDDGTLEILRKYEDRIDWVSEKDDGQAHAVNKGIERSRGDIIGWLNSDDVYYESALQTVLDFFNENPEADAVYGDADHIDSYDNVIESYYTEKWDYERLKEVCFLCQPAVFFRRRLVEKNGLLDVRLRYCMDYDYWLRAGKVKPFAYIMKKLAGSRMYGSNKTMGERTAVHKEINDMFREKFGKVPDKWIFSYAHTIVKRKGYDREDKIENAKFVLSLTAASLYSFAKWSQPVSYESIKTMAGWMKNIIT